MDKKEEVIFDEACTNTAYNTRLIVFKRKPTNVAQGRRIDALSQDE